jgi:hypothetical protein
MDNCGRENKNKDIMAYCSFLVDCGLFSKVEVTFLPVGHTHEDIDQLFSVFSAYFKCHNAITINELKKNIITASSKVKLVTHIEQVAQIKQMMQEQHWIEPVFGNF